MPSSEQQGAASSKPVSELEKLVCWRARAAAEQLKRVECLDEEQRAEIHSILEAIRHDSESRAAPSTWGTYVPVRPHAVDERASLRQRFCEVLQAVTEAAEALERQASVTADPTVREQFKRLAHEQRRHLEMVERLLDIINE